MEIKTKRVVEKFQIQQFSVGTFLHVCFNSRIDIKKFSTAVGGDFYMFFLCLLAKIGLFPGI